MAHSNYVRLYNGSIVFPEVDQVLEHIVSAPTLVQEVAAMPPYKLNMLTDHVPHVKLTYLCSKMDRHFIQYFPVPHS